MGWRITGPNSSGYQKSSWIVPMFLQKESLHQGLQDVQEWIFLHSYRGCAGWRESKDILHFTVWASGRKIYTLGNQIQRLSKLWSPYTLIPYIWNVKKGGIDTKHLWLPGAGSSFDCKWAEEILKSWWKYPKIGLVNAKAGNEDCTALLD